MFITSHHWKGTTNKLVTFLPIPSNTLRYSFPSKIYLCVFSQNILTTSHPVTPCNTKRSHRTHALKFQKALGARSVAPNISSSAVQSHRSTGVRAKTRNLRVFETVSGTCNNSRVKIIYFRCKCMTFLSQGGVNGGLKNVLKYRAVSISAYFNPINIFAH